MSVNLETYITLDNMQRHAGNEDTLFVRKSQLHALLGVDNFFEIDVNGGLMPAETPTYSATWELDGDGGIMPIDIS
jgi:hypothetical protein